MQFKTKYHLCLSNCQNISIFYWFILFFLKCLFSVLKRYNEKHTLSTLFKTMSICPMFMEKYYVLKYQFIFLAVLGVTLSWDAGTAGRLKRPTSQPYPEVLHVSHMHSPQTSSENGDCSARRNVPRSKNGSYRSLKTQRHNLHGIISAAFYWSKHVPGSLPIPGNRNQVASLSGRSGKATVTILIHHSNI